MDPLSPEAVRVTTGEHTIAVHGGGGSQRLLCYVPSGAELTEVAIKLQKHFLTSRPFRHVVIDGLFPEDVLDAVVAEVPRRDKPRWTVWGSGSRYPDSADATKKGISHESLVGPLTRNFMLQLNSEVFLYFLRTLTGIHGLLGDGSFRGGGIHNTGPGGRLLVHSDVERHPHGRPFCQAINLILYLNKDWSESYGGHLELWSRDGTRCEQRILPVFNRTVIFESGTNTFHGHPQPLTCPPDRSRLSLASYYYLTSRPFDGNYTEFQKAVKWIHDKP